MENNSQKKVFVEYEANKWFERNKDYIVNYTPEKDHVIALISKYQLASKKVLEIGCSAGYRLSAIHENYLECEVYGIEPSSNAIDYGKKNFLSVNFIQGTSDNMQMFADSSFDLIIVGFVFYVVDRELLLRTISEIDRILKDNGHLIIIDFYASAPIKRSYQHISEFEAFSFKQNYDQAFTSTCLYNLLDKSTYHHQSYLPDASSDLNELYSISLLKKDTNRNYK